MVKHSERPTKLWDWTPVKGWSSPGDYMQPSTGRHTVFWSCEVADVEALGVPTVLYIPAICRECAVRLGLEW